MSETPQTADKRNFAREMPKLKVDNEQTRAISAGAKQAHEQWLLQVEKEREKDAQAAIDLEKRIKAGDFQPDPESYAREMKRPVVKGRSKLLNKLTGRN